LQEPVELVLIVRVSSSPVLGDVLRPVEAEVVNVRPLVEARHGLLADKAVLVSRVRKAPRLPLPVGAIPSA